MPRLAAILPLSLFFGTAALAGPLGFDDEDDLLGRDNFDSGADASPGDSYYGGGFGGGGFGDSGYGDEFEIELRCRLACNPWDFSADSESDGNGSGDGEWDGAAPPEAISDVVRIQYEFDDFDSFMVLFNELPINEQYETLAQGYYAAAVTELAHGNVEGAAGMLGFAESYLTSLEATGADMSSYQAMRDDIASFTQQGYESMTLNYVDSANSAIAVVGGVYYTDHDGHLVFASVGLVDALYTDGMKDYPRDPCEGPFCASAP